MAKKKGIIRGPWPQHNPQTSREASYSKEANNVVHGWWTRQGDPPMSTNTFRIRTRRLFTNLSVALDALSYVHKLFGNEKEIWPDQFERAIALIRDVKEPIQKLSQLLENTSQLPVTAVPLRYPLAIALHDADKQLQDVIVLITQLCNKEVSPRQVAKQTQKIQYTLELIRSSCSEILQKGYSLLEEVHRQKQIVNL